MSISQPDVLANPLIPLTRMGYIDQFTKIANDAIQDTIRGFEPHSLTTAEVQDVRRVTIRRMTEVQMLEAALEASGGPPNFHIENNLFTARVKFRAIFSRIFRINDLPDEILTDIFRLVIWTGPSPAVSNNWRLWLTWVCKKWRKMVLSDSTLWNAIWFRDGFPFNRSFAWFDRAGSTPLDIRITDTLDLKYNAEVMSKMLDRLLTKVNQLRIFIVIVEAWEPLLVVLDRFQKVAKLNCPMVLERFELHRSPPNYLRIEDIPESSKFRLPIPLFGGAHLPTFRSLSLNGLYVDWSNAQLSNLTTIDFRRMPLTRSPPLAVFRDMLRSSPNLYKLCLDGAGPQWQVEASQALEPLHLPNLKRLVFANFSLDYSMYLLQQIHAPNVRDLHLFNLIGEDYTPMFAYLTGRFPEVRMLTIYAVEVTPSPVMLRWLTSLRKLIYLRVANMQPFFLNFFLQRADPVAPRGYPPGLQAFVVCPCIIFLELNSGINADQAKGWIVQRQNLGCPLRKVYITKALSLTMTDQQHQELAKICHLYRLEIGASPPEEEWLLSL